MKQLHFVPILSSCVAAKDMRELIFFFLITLSGFILASDIDEEVCLRQKYQAPAELSRLLDKAYEHNEEFRKCLQDPDSEVCECPNDMACYIKKKRIMQRIIGHQKARQIIDDEKLNEILLPSKYLWRGFLVAEKLQPINGRTLDGITKEQLSQLILFAYKGRFRHFIGGRRFGINNVFFTNDCSGKHFWKEDQGLPKNSQKKIALIDTKFFCHKDLGPFLHDLWLSFSKEESTPQCRHRTMKESADVDSSFKPHDFEAFWQKYKDCFQA